MRRLYLHFYAFILLAVVGLGWSLEQIWRVQSEAPPEIPAWVQPFALSVVQASRSFESAEQPVRVHRCAGAYPPHHECWLAVGAKRGSRPRKRSSTL